MTIDYSIKVTQCEPMPGYKLKVTCSDGATGIFDMSRYVDRGMFKPPHVRRALMARRHRHRRGTRPLRHANHLEAHAHPPRPSSRRPGPFHARMHDGHDAPPTTHRPRDFFAGPSRFPAPSVQTHRRFHDGRLA